MVFLLNDYVPWIRILWLDLPRPIQQTRTISSFLSCKKQMALLKINRKISLDLAYFPKKEGQLQAFLTELEIN